MPRGGAEGKTGRSFPRRIAAQRTVNADQGLRPRQLPRDLRFLRVIQGLLRGKRLQVRSDSSAIAFLSQMRIIGGGGLIRG